VDVFRSIYLPNGLLCAQVYDLNKMSSSTFPTPEFCSLQFGFGSNVDKKEFKPHVHKRVSRTIDNTAEFLFVLEGKMTIDLLDESGVFLEQLSLTKDQCFLQFYGGHHIKLSEKSRYFEIKQGPYFGYDYDKFEV
jgi:hypothetical protein